MRSRADCPPHATKHGYRTAVRPSMTRRDDQLTHDGQSPCRPLIVCLMSASCLSQCPTRGLHSAKILHPESARSLTPRGIGEFLCQEIEPTMPGK